MVEQDELSRFLTSTDAAGERILWQGLVAIAEFALEDGEYAPPRWSLPETTEVTVTDRRIAYAHVAPAPGAWPLDPGSPEQPHEEVTSGEIRWLWPQHLRVQPGARAGNTPHEIHLVCGSTSGGWPALVLFGGDLKTVADADRVANLLRKSITQFRLDNARLLEIPTPKARMLSRLLLTPEFSNYPSGPGQTVSLPGALPLTQPSDNAQPAHAAQPDQTAHTAQPDYVAQPADVMPQPIVTPPPAEPMEWREPTPRPAPVRQPIPVEYTMPVQTEFEARTVELTLRPRHGAHAVEPDDLAARASNIAARVAELVNWNSGLTQDDPTFDEPPTPPDATAPGATSGAETGAAPDWPVRPSAARFATNSGPIRAEIRRAVPSPGADPTPSGRHR